MFWCRNEREAGLSGHFSFRRIHLIKKQLAPPHTRRCWNTSIRCAMDAGLYVCRKAIDFFSPVAVMRLTELQECDKQRENANRCSACTQRASLFKTPHHLDCKFSPWCLCFCGLQPDLLPACMKSATLPARQTMLGHVQLDLPMCKSKSAADETGLSM